MCRSPLRFIDESISNTVVLDRNTPLRCCGFLPPPSVAHMSKLQLRRKCCMRFSYPFPVEPVEPRVSTRIETADSRSEPSMQPLAVLLEVDLICHLWQRYVTMALLPLASSSVTVRREMVVFNNQAVSRIEGGANQVTQKLTDGMLPCR